jgi:hypothetical protein
MTIKVTVKNEDTRDTAVIGVRQMNSSNEPFRSDTQNGPTKELKAGESAEVWVHSGQYLIVREVSQ